jgi:flagellar assembly factor FliW
LENESPFKWLQAVEQSYPALAIISPFEIIPDYEFDINTATVELLDIKEPSEVAVYVVVVIPEEYHSNDCKYESTYYY